MTSFFPRCRLPASLGFALALVFTPALAQQAPAPTEAQMAAARQVVVGSGLSRSFDGIVGQMVGQMYGTITRTRPELGPDLKIALSTLEQEFAPQSAKMVDRAATIMASKLTEAELKDTAAFFASASGKKYVAAQPLALDEIVVSLEDWRKEISGSLSERLRAEMKKKGYNL